MNHCLHSWSFVHALDFLTSNIALSKIQVAAGDSQLPPTFRGDDSLASGLSEDARPKDSWEPSHRAVQVRGLESTSGGLP